LVFAHKKDDMQVQTNPRINMKIKKRSGKEEEFSSSKTQKSMVKAGASEKSAKTVSDTIKPVQGMNTSQVRKNVILELISSLNIEESGEMGEILLRTYRGLFIKLNVACIESDVEKITEVRDSLIELNSAWGKVFQSAEYLEFKRDRERFLKKQRTLSR